MQEALTIATMATVITAIVDALKGFITDTRYIPILSILLGATGGLLIEGDWRVNMVAGAVAGAAAVGVHEAKSTGKALSDNT